MLSIMLAWFLMIIFIIRLKFISKSNNNIEWKWIVWGNATEDMKLISFIWKKKHKKYNDSILNITAIPIIILYYPSIITLIVISLFHLIYIRI